MRTASWMTLLPALVCLLLLGVPGRAGKQAPWQVQPGPASSHPRHLHQANQPTEQAEVDTTQALRHTTIERVDARGRRRTWQRYTHAAFPRHAVRLQENVTLCDPDVRQVVGYLDVGEDKHFFFWLSESRSKPATDPLVLWLNGGPGCSSLTGLFMELGPCRVDQGGQDTTRNPYSWNSNANVIFLDQPVNVGFSYSEGSGVSTTEEAAEDVYAFLQVLLAALPRFARAPFHITGESYAGHYIPAMGKVITDRNRELRQRVATQQHHDKHPDVLEIRLASLAIGNGLTDPLIQYKYYADMAADKGYGPILPKAKIAEMRKKYPTCKALINACYQSLNTLACVPAAIYCNSAMINPFQETGLNIYDVRKQCDQSKTPLCYEIIQDIETYLNLEDVQAELGVDRAYEGCKMDINLKFMFAGDWMKPFVRDLPPLLEEGIRVLIYAGDADYICNWIGNKAWTRALPWHGQRAFDQQPDHVVKSKLTGRAMGEARTVEGFTFLRVYEAGHMVPYDQPEHSLEFINAWLFNKTL